MFTPVLVMKLSFSSDSLCIAYEYCLRVFIRNSLTTISIKIDNEGAHVAENVLVPKTTQ